MADLNEKFVSEWIKPQIDVRQDDILKFEDEGNFKLATVPDGKGGQKEQTQMDVAVLIVKNGKQKRMSINATNRKACIKLFGAETKGWVGKEVQVNIVKVNNPRTGELVDGIVLTRPNVDMQGNIKID